MKKALPPSLARAQAWAHTQPWLRRFTLMNRLLLAMAFLPTGLVKLAGHRFTTLPIENPIGFFFEAMYRTGAYWHFIGLVQVVAAVALLIPATATLGALLFLPIGISILLITWGMGFGGTPIVAAGMLLSVIYLLCWDADRIWAGASHLLGRRQGGSLLEGANRVEQAGWLLGGVVGMALFLSTRDLVPITFRRELFFLGIGAAILVVAGWIIAGFRKRQQGD
jgi:hypothetical protein